jgi:hypothetical protein
MKKKSLKVYTIALFVITAPVLFIYLTFSNSIDCSQMVIDTYEIHSGINIPKVDFVNCYYDENANTRISVYDLVGKISMNKFELVNASTQTELLQGQFLLAENEQPKASTLYIASGEKRGTKWTYLVDTSSKRLWAELNY